jgi:hypothetical protein
MLLGMDDLTTLRAAPLLVMLLVELVLIGWGTGYVTSAIYSLVPWRPLSYPLLLPGTVMHELAHAVAAMALGLGIEELVLFRPTPSADGSVRLGWVTPQRSARLRGDLMAAAPLLLVPPMLLAMVLTALAMPTALWGVSGALWIVVALGCLGAFPSSGDRISFRGGLTVVGGCFVAGLALYLVGGEQALSAVLAGGVLGLLVPALVFAFVLAVKFVRRDDENAPVMIIVVRDRPRGLPKAPAPPWPRPPGRRR